MTLVPECWLVDGLFEELTLVMPALRVSGEELVPSPSGEIRDSRGRRLAPVTRQIVRSLQSVETSNGVVVLRLARVSGVRERSWHHPPHGLSLDEIKLTRERGGLDDASALERLAGPRAMANRHEWPRPEPLERIPHPLATVWTLNSWDLGYEPGATHVLVDFGENRAFSLALRAALEWSRLELVPKGQHPPPRLVEDGLPLP